VQSGDVTLRRDWQSLEELAGSALATVGPALREHDVRISLPSNMPLIHCDGALIERILVNLLENAAKYTPAGTRVEIAATTTLEAVEVTVSDDGPGLPAGDTEALFDKFTRGKQESAVPGVGLGLAICRAIVEAHGGRIGASRRPGGGARFTFSLPLARTPPQVELEPTA
jgi:two-component system sensor histidine kinase KdpD